MEQFYFLFQFNTLLGYSTRSIIKKDTFHLYKFVTLLFIIQYQYINLVE